MSNARIITKKVVNIVVTTTVGFTAANAVASSTNPTTKIQKIEVVIGSYILASLITEKTSEWTDKKVDAAFDWYNATFEKAL